MYLYLQRVIYDGHLKLFGSQLNPVGCAALYKTQRLRECFDYAEPRVGDNLSMSEDIYIGHFFMWKASTTTVGLIGLLVLCAAEGLAGRQLDRLLAANAGGNTQRPAFEDPPSIFHVSLNRPPAVQGAGGQASSGTLPSDYTRHGWPRWNGPTATTLLTKPWSML